MLLDLNYCSTLPKCSTCTCNLRNISRDLNHINERGFTSINRGFKLNSNNNQTEDISENFRRIRFVLQYIQKMFKNSETSLFTIEFIDRLNENLESIAEDLNQCANTEVELEKYVSINKKIDELINGNKFLFWGCSPNVSESNMEYYNDVKELKNIINSQKQRLDQAIDRFKEESTKIVLDYTNNVNAHVNTLKCQRENIREESNVFFEKYKEELEALKKQAQDIVGVIGSSGLSSNYKKEANRTGVFTMFWQAVTILFLFGLGDLGYQVGVMVVDPSIVLIQVMPKMIIISIGALIIKYTASQVRYYQEREAESRKIELELASLDPFIAVLEADEKQLLKTKLAENYFIGPKSKVVTKEENINFSHWLKEIFDACRSFNKQKQ